MDNLQNDIHNSDVGLCIDDSSPHLRTFSAPPHSQHQWSCDDEETCHHDDESGAPLSAASRDRRNTWSDGDTLFGSPLNADDNHQASADDIACSSTPQRCSYQHQYQRSRRSPSSSSRRQRRRRRPRSESSPDCHYQEQNAPKIMQRPGKAYLRLLFSVCTVTFMIASNGTDSIRSNGVTTEVGDSSLMLPYANPYEHEEVQNFFVQQHPTQTPQQKPSLPKYQLPKVAPAHPKQQQAGTKHVNLAMARALPHELPVFGAEPQQQQQPSWKQLRFTLQDDDKTPVHQQHQQHSAHSWTRNVVGLLLTGMIIEWIIQEYKQRRNGRRSSIISNRRLPIPRRL